MIHLRWTNSVWLKYIHDDQQICLLLCVFLYNFKCYKVVTTLVFQGYIISPLTFFIVCNHFFLLYLTKVLLGNLFFCCYPSELMCWFDFRCVLLNIPVRWKIAKVYRNLTITCICIADKLLKLWGLIFH